MLNVEGDCDAYLQSEFNRTSNFSLHLTDHGVKGRGITAGIAISSSQEIMTTVSMLVATDESLRSTNCLICGIFEADMVSRCSCGVFCSLCNPDAHFASGECYLMSTFYTNFNYALPMQALLAFRVVANLPKGNCISPFSLVGSENDCDDVRLKLAAQLFSIIQEDIDKKNIKNDYLHELIHKNPHIFSITLGILYRNSFKIGAAVALFPSVSFFNHSCSPNAIITVEYTPSNNIETCIDRTLSVCVRALRNISPGEEITVSYVTPLGLNPYFIRQNIIFHKKGFVCNCDACVAYELIDHALLSTVHIPPSPPMSQAKSLAKSNLKFAVSSCDDRSQARISHDISEEEQTLHLKLFQDINSIEYDIDHYNTEPNDGTLASIKFAAQIIKKKIQDLKAGSSHYLRLYFLVQLTELSLSLQKTCDVALYADSWIVGMEQGTTIPIRDICDPHLLCRMHVLRAESMADIVLIQKNLLVKDNKKYLESTVSALDSATNISTTIYGVNYALVDILKNRKQDILNLLQNISLDSIKCSAINEECSINRSLVDSDSDSNSNQITKTSVASYVQDFKVVRLVGFVSGLQYHDLHSLSQAELLIQRLLELFDSGIITGVIIDGENFSEFSFSYLLREVNRRNPKVVICMGLTADQNEIEILHSWIENGFDSSAINFAWYSAKNSIKKGMFQIEMKSCNCWGYLPYVFCYGGEFNHLEEYNAYMLEYMTCAYTTNPTSRKESNDQFSMCLRPGSELFFFYDIPRIRCINSSNQKSKNGTKKGNKNTGKEKKIVNIIDVTKETSALSKVLLSCDANYC